MIIGVGVDLVGIESFAQQLDSPGTVYARAFTGQERRTAKNRANTSGSVAGHLAARWAAKEAFIKAWSAALIGTRPRSPKKRSTGHRSKLFLTGGRPTLTIHEPLAAAVKRSLAERYGRGSTTWHISMSHDGGMAMATAIADRTSS